MLQSVPVAMKVGLKKIDICQCLFTAERSSPIKFPDPQGSFPEFKECRANIPNPNTILPAIDPRKRGMPYCMLRPASSMCNQKSDLCKFCSSAQLSTTGEWL